MAVCSGIRQWSKLKFITAGCLFSEIIVWGLMTGMVGTSMLDLELVTGSSTAQVSFLWTAITVGSFVVSPLAGYVLDKSDPRLFLGISQLGFGIMVSSLPYASNFLQLMCLAAVTGIFVGSLDIGRNITAVKLWRWDGAMWLQFYHFVYAVASATAPLLVRPFLADQFGGNTTINGTLYITTNTSLQALNDGKATYDSSLLPANDAGLSASNTTEGLPQPESRIHIIFMIVGSLIFTSGAVCLAMYVYVKQYVQKPRTAGVTSSSMEMILHKKDTWYVVAMVILLFLRFSCIVGIEVVEGNMLMTFLVKGLGWTVSAGVMAVFTLRVTFATSRGFGVGLANVLTPTKIMLLDIGLLAVSFSLLLLAHSFPNTTWLIWLSIGMSGFGNATLYSASMSWAEHYLQVNGRIGSLFLVGSSAGVLAYPPLAGYLFERYTPWAFVFVMCGLTVMLGVVTVISVVIAQKYRRNHPTHFLEMEKVISPEEMVTFKTENNVESDKINTTEKTGGFTSETQDKLLSDSETLEKSQMSLNGP